MKKLLLSIFLIVCLCAAFLPTFAAADTPTIQGKGTEAEPWILTQKVFNEASSSSPVTSNESGSVYYLETGYYRLEGDITLGTRIQIGFLDSATVTLDLNGHKLECTSNENATVYVYRGSLTLEDTSEGKNGVIVSGKSYGVNIGIYGCFVMNGGTICAEKNGVLNDGTFTMNGGAFDACGTSINNNGTMELHVPTLDGTVINGYEFEYQGVACSGKVKNSGSMGDQKADGVFCDTVYNGYYNDALGDQTAGIIFGGVFRGEVINYAATDGPSLMESEINGGLFYKKVTNQSQSMSGMPAELAQAKITGGVFYGKVENDGVISGGVFFGGITEGGEITGTQRKITVDTDNGAAVKEGVVVGDKLYPMEEPTKEGYRFTGWYALGSDTPWDFEKDTVTGDIALTAGWESTQPEEEPDENPDSAAGLAAILDDMPFVDVNFTDYYYDSVKWAYHSGITGGTDAWHFSPDAGCTRAQAVTFLWRAAGSPSASYLGNFTDVDADAYYAPAVAWAVANGVTNGTSATTFSPDAACSRGDIVTFLFRAFGGASNGYHPFTDVPASAYYADAVAWAYEHGVTGGTSADKFSPADACSRAQIVTFLYRVLG